MGSIVIIRNSEYGESTTKFERVEDEACLAIEELVRGNLSNESIAKVLSPSMLSFWLIVLGQMRHAIGFVNAEFRMKHHRQVFYMLRNFAYGESEHLDYAVQLGFCEKAYPKGKTRQPEYRVTDSGLRHMEKIYKCGFELQE